MSSLVAPTRSLDLFPDLAPLAAGAAFEIRREDIDWRLLGPGELEIEVTIRNRSTRMTPPTSATVRSAVFGAFVEQRPLTTLAVPPIPPHGRVRLTAVVPVAALAPRDVAREGDDGALRPNRVATLLSETVERPAMWR